MPIRKQVPVDQLPSYKNPPVVETAIAIQFRPLKSVKNVHLWGFWSEIRDEYPDTQDQEPLDQKMELFGDEIQRGPHLPRIQFRPHASRVQALSADKHAMVQIQNGRFIFNWRRLEGGTYPRWTQTSGRFWPKYQQFTQFIAAQKLGDINPDQWEVTYVNHLMQGEDWQSEADWPELLPGLIGACNRVTAGELEAADSSVQFALKDEAGRLHVDLKRAVLASNTNQDLLVLTLTARGATTTECPPEEGLAVGRQAIVTAFTEITGDAAHKRWGRTQ